MYRVSIENKARKEAQSLPDEIWQRILQALEQLEQEPRPAGTRKLTGIEGWRLRVGDYRILYTIDDEQNFVTVYQISHRKSAYR